MTKGKWRRISIAAGFILLLALVVLLPAQETAAANPTFTLLYPEEGSTVVMTVGDTLTITVQVDSPGEPFIWARALGDDYYPGRGAVIRGGDMVRDAEAATLQLTLFAKSPTADLPSQPDPMGVVVGARYPGGEIHSEAFGFNVIVNPE